jgi:hypothetical protein
LSPSATTVGDAFALLVRLAKIVTSREALAAIPAAGIMTVLSTVRRPWI